MSEERSPLIAHDNQSYSVNDNNQNNSNSDNSPNTPIDPTDPTDLISSAPIASTSILSTSTVISSTDQTMSTLPLMTKIGFGLGHIYNDLCAGVWFSYTLLFMQNALHMPGTWIQSFGYLLIYDMQLYFINEKYFSII